MDTGLLAWDVTKTYSAANIAAGIAPSFGQIQAGQNGSEFIFLKGVASLAAGDVVTYNRATGVTVRGVANGIGKVGVSMVANTAATVGSWFQIKGLALANVATGFAAGAVTYLTATAGVVDDAKVTGDGILGCVSATAISSSQAYLDINYPYVTALFPAA